jgi:hypothetical protein
MMKMTAAYQVVRALGYLAFALGVWNFISDHWARVSSGSFWNSYSSAFGLADDSLVLVGMVAIVVAECLKKIEERLSAMEKISRSQT